MLGNRIAVMTRRPGRIRDFFDFDMPRPRDITSPAFKSTIGLSQALADRIAHTSPDN